MKRIRCPCGKVLALPEGSRAAKFRCPACGAVLRVRAGEKSTRGAAARAAMTTPEADDAGYEVVLDPEPAAVANAATSSSAPAPVWTPSEATTLARSRHIRAHTIPAGSSYGTADVAVAAEDFPGPFIDRSALLFPFLHPTWACWIGLSFVTALAIAAVGVALFFLTVIMITLSFVSLFTFANMVIACVALVGYVITTIENVFEETAHGGNRLARLPGLSFADNLPSFFRMAGALLSTIAAAGSLVYFLRNHLGPWETEEWAVNPIVVLELMLIFDVVAWALFPIFVISNSVEQSFWPIWALHTTVLRLVKCAGYYAVFLIVSAVAGIAINLLLSVLSLIHLSVSLVAVGPLWAMYLLYYSHWLGRVVRQMTAQDEEITLPRWLVVVIRTASLLVVFAVPGWWLTMRVVGGLGGWYTVSDGTYIMRMQPDGEQAPPGQQDHDVVELRFGKDGTIQFLDQVGREQKTRGKITKGAVELSHKFEGLVMEGNGKVTGKDKMEGTCTLKFLDVQLDQTKVIQKKAKWSLVKQK